MRGRHIIREGWEGGGAGKAKRHIVDIWRLCTRIRYIRCRFMLRRCE